MGSRMTFKGVLATGLALLMCACTRVPAEQRLRETMAAMETAIEDGDIAGFIEHVGPDFNGNDGQFDRRQLHGWLRALTLRRERIGISTGPYEIRLHAGGRATVKVDAVVTGSAGGWLPDSGRHVKVESVWREDDGQWRCVSANWTD
ncbi:hypothetical protein [Pseudofulvimonas gallinarii]|jgi:hypothetical protein|uniref:Ketosteroid isomerase-like protein n=2 Tax=Pseudofulvimonas gallinarii TaxID=634155 RepID=A0A4R3LM61_9GAMM|nr:hypothetical protein [Pseudofulvimonas gallinarii]TCT00706.1 hypothetical protein EDC25_10270 [Pseudofulvimonas gallinarii]